MTTAAQHRPRIAIACGGTGGHFFPGVAVAEDLREQGCDVLLFVSSKQVDQQALESVPHLPAISLPAAALTRTKLLGAVAGFAASLRAAHAAFRNQPCDAVLAMGGFTSAPPVLAGKWGGAAVFLHESNTIPGRAISWLSRLATRCFVGFPQTADHLTRREVLVTGTPVRPAFVPADPRGARKALNLDPDVPVLLVTGGSQGAMALNNLAPQAAALLQQTIKLQVLHLTGVQDSAKVTQAYQKAGIRARVLPFLDRMDLALQSAAAAITRAGASSLAELSAIGTPAVLIPYPSAAGNHQYYNASAFSESSAARLVQQSEATPQSIAALLEPLLQDTSERRAMVVALSKWHAPNAARAISQSMMQCVAQRESGRATTTPGRGIETPCTIA